MLRYRIDDSVVPSGASGTADFIFVTVIFTLLIGIGFIIAGIRGHQHWLAIWGVITCLVCTAYFVIPWFI